MSEPAGEVDVLDDAFQDVRMTLFPWAQTSAHVVIQLLIDAMLCIPGVPEAVVRGISSSDIVTDVQEDARRLLWELIE
jgi:hypothetical protein